VNLETYKTWLEGREYRPATIRGSLLGLGAVRKQYDAAVPMATIVSNYHSYQYVRRYSAWISQTGRDPADAFERDALLFAPDGVPLAPRRGTMRKRPAVSVKPGDWDKLVARLQMDDSVEGRALYAMSSTGLRIGDLLGLERVALASGLTEGTMWLQQKGGHMRELPIGDGTREAWQRLGLVVEVIGESQKPKKAETTIQQ